MRFDEAGLLGAFRDRLIVLLAAKAGLRAGEIANLTWDMAVDGNGQISRLRRGWAISAQEAIRPIRMSSIHPGALAIAVSRGTMLTTLAHSTLS
jgi:integrase